MRAPSPVHLACQILVQTERIVDSSTDPLDAGSVAALGSLWRPGSVADRDPPLAPTGDADQPVAVEPGTPMAAVLAPMVAGLLLSRCAWRARRRTGAAPARRTNAHSPAQHAPHSTRGGAYMTISTHAPSAPPRPTARRVVRWSRRRVRANATVRLLVVAAVLLAASTHGASAAPSQTPGVLQQPDARDPLVVVEGFLAARNAHDSLGAVAWCADPLAIHDAEDQWLADAPSVRAWLEHLTGVYWIDLLERPHADGDRVTWVERLAPRNLPFRDALASSIRVDVEAVVQNGKMIALDAAYPPAAPGAFGDVPRATNAAGHDPAVVPPWALFGASWAALAVGLALVVVVRSVRRRADQGERGGAPRQAGGTGAR